MTVLRLPQLIGIAASPAVAVRSTAAHHMVFGLALPGPVLAVASKASTYRAAAFTPALAYQWPRSQADWRRVPCSVTSSDVIAVWADSAQNSSRAVIVSTGNSQWGNPLLGTKRLIVH